MNSFSGSLWLRLFTAALGHSAALESRPRLAPFVMDFNQIVTLLRVVLSVPEGQDPELDALRLTARTWDTEHDEGHRSFVRLIEAFLGRGTPEHQAAVEGALALLYPAGLSVVNLSYAEEVGAAQVLSDRRKAPEIEAGLAVLRAEVPGVDTWIDRIVNAGASLGEALDAIDERLSTLAGKDTTSGKSYIQALNACRQTWNFFLTTVAYELRGGTPEDESLRELLVGPYLRELERQRKPKPQPPTEPSPPDQPIA